ncbi:MAG: alpha/beta hydrolase [Pseudomonadota bacterium]
MDRWPPIGRLLEVDRLSVHAWEQGSGQPVVLIHGASGNLRDWTFALAPRLARDYRVIAFDRPGFGYSDRLADRGWEPARQAAHLRKALEQLTDLPPIVVGHSWGGALAMAWGLADPAAKGIVTLCGATMPWGGALDSYYSYLASEFTGRPLSHLISALATERRTNEAIAGIFQPQAVPQGYPAYVGVALATRPRTLRDNARDLVNLERLLTEQSARYPQLSTPVEILHGTADTIVDAGIHAEGMHNLLPNSRLTLLEGIGHMTHHADPVATIAAISRLA